LCKCLLNILSRNISFSLSNDPSTTEIYTLSLHDALPICRSPGIPVKAQASGLKGARAPVQTAPVTGGRKSRASFMGTALRFSRVEPVKFSAISQTRGILLAGRIAGLPLALDNGVFTVSVGPRTLVAAGTRPGAAATMTQRHDQAGDRQHVADQSRECDQRPGQHAPHAGLEHGTWIAVGQHLLLQPLEHAPALPLD